MLLDQLWRCEDRARTLDRADERVDVALFAVDIERRPRRGGDAEPPHEGLRAVMPRANADAVLVQYRCEIVGVDVGHREAHDTAPLLRLRTEHMNAFHLRQPARQKPYERALVGEHDVLADAIEIVARVRLTYAISHI